MAQVPVRLRDGFPFVTAAIAGRPVTMLLDTGAQGHLVLPDAAARLRLPSDPGRVTRALGTGGAQDAPNVLLRGLTLGGAPLPDSSSPVLPLPSLPMTDPPLAGLLGAPLLAAYDVDLDVGAGRLTLLAPTGCAPGGGSVALHATPDGDTVLPVQVNGTALLAIPDTGTRATLLSLSAARRLGLDAPVSANTARGIDGQPMLLRHLRLQELRVGPVAMANAPASITDLQLGPASLLLGLDFFLQHRVWLSYATRQMAVLPAAAPTRSP